MKTHLVKNISRSLIVAASLLFSVIAQAQTDKQQQQAGIKKAIDNRNFEFTAEFARRDNGNDIRIDQQVQLVFKDGKITSYLPSFSFKELSYYSSAYNVQFESKKYELKVAEKKSGCDIIVKVLDCSDIRQINVHVTPDGKYSTVRILGYNYTDPINFSGVISPGVSETVASLN